MKLYKPQDLNERTGDIMLLYGDTGVGKSVTAIQTAPDPIIYIMTEGRDVTKILKAAQRPDVKIAFGFYTTWEELLAFVCDHENMNGAKSLIIDSLSHLMTANLGAEIEDEAFDSLDKKKGVDKPLAMRTKMSLEGYGALSGEMRRFTAALAKLSQIGMTVVCLARSEQNPKFNRALAGAPALKGREYAKDMPGYFDFIGYVEQRVEDGLVQYPPFVSFESDGSYMCKWNGIKPEAGVYKRILHIEKILKASHGE